MQYCRMESLEQNGHFTLVTNLGNLNAKRVVYATHTPPGVNILHTLIAPYRSYVVAAELDQVKNPEGLIYDMEDPYHYFRMHREKGRSFLIAGGADHKTGDITDTAKPYKDLEEYVQRYFKVKRFAFQWSSQYYESSDGLAYIGELPGEKNNVFTATGFGGNGMIYSHMTAIILKDLILKGYSEYGEIFSPKRIKPLASAGKFAKENADVVKELVSGILPKEKLEATLDLHRGEGKVVEYEGKKMGIYRDPAGNLYAVNPVCPHMKCVVEWNKTEKSWDCPCHGSRFSYTGELLNGPSRHDLEVIVLKKQSSL